MVKYAILHCGLPAWIKWFKENVRKYDLKKCYCNSYREFLLRKTERQFNGAKSVMNINSQRNKNSTLYLILICCTIDQLYKLFYWRVN